MWAIRCIHLECRYSFMIIKMIDLFSFLFTRTSVILFQGFIYIFRQELIALRVWNYYCFILSRVIYCSTKPMLLLCFYIFLLLETFQQLQKQACQQVIDAAEKEYKKMSERINEGQDAMKVHICFLPENHLYYFYIKHIKSHQFYNLE